MKAAAKWQLVLGLVAVAGFSTQGQSATPKSQKTSPSFTIHVRNDAGVDSQTLNEAEKVASGIFQQAGVVSHWVDAPPTSKDIHDEPSLEPQSFGLSQIRVNILSAAMSDRMNLPAGVTGLAPGAGPDRLLAYVFYERVEGIAHREAQRQAATAQAEGNAAPRASEAQILGVVIAHEIGHILLNLAVHTHTGIMRGEWDLDGLRDVAQGYVSFTKQQAEVMQAEVARRARRQDVIDAAGPSKTSGSLAR